MAWVTKGAAARVKNKSKNKSKNKPHAQGAYGKIVSSFRYAQSELFVLQDLNVAIGEGEFVVIAGPSVCGRTILLKIMLGLLSPTSGTVRIGNVDIKPLGLRHYRTIIAAVTQDDQLFAGSIADNISFLNSTPNQAWFDECGKMVSIT